MDGTSLLHYRILRKIGQGGMGEVYLAQDTRLDKLVALKMLPELIRQDEHRLRRFRNEAKAAARLDHPNIVRIFGIDEAEGLTFFVMEYVDGKALKDCIGKKGGSIDQFYNWFIPITNAIAHAHDQGVIHRDLKPANIMISEDGVPKVLDFGLARIERRDLEEAEPLSTPSLGPEATTIEKDMLQSFTSSLTSPNAVVGTAAYMSPEQAQAKPVDFRSDLFSLGIVMYETLTGNQPFRGDTTLSTFSNLLQLNPSPTTTLKPASPPGLWRLIRRCLQKEPNQRYQATLDVAIDLEELKENKDTLIVELDSGAYSPIPSSSIDLWRKPAVLSGGLLLFLLGALFIYAAQDWWMPPPPEKLVRKFKIPIEGTLSRQDNPVISPDGKKIAYTHRGRLWVRELDKVDSREISGTQGADAPFWSPNSDWIGFVQDFGVKDKPHTLMKVSFDGEKKIILTELPGLDVWGATWGVDGDIVLGIQETFSRATLYKISDQSGSLEPYLEPDSTKNELMIAYPHFLPDNESILFSVLKADTSLHLYGRFENVNRMLISDPRNKGFYVPYFDPAGYIVCRYGSITRGELWGVEFDISSIEVGTPFLIAQNGFDPSVSSDGTLVYKQSSAPLEELVWANRNGKIIDVIGQSQPVIEYIALSPDDKRVAVSGMENKNFDIWVHEENENKNRISFHPSFDGDPAWSPDGREIVFAGQMEQEEPTKLFITRSDGTSESRILVASETSLAMPNWSPMGRYIIYQKKEVNNQYDLWSIELNQEPEPQIYLRSAADEVTPVFSPDGRYIAYASNASGEYEIYVSSFPTGKGLWQISTNGGVCPHWIKDELFFIEGNTLMTCEVSTSSVFEKTNPVPLFSGERAGMTLYYTGNPSYRSYSVSRESNRFVLVRSKGERNMDIIMVQNWKEEEFKKP